MEPLLEASHLSVVFETYAGTVHAVQDVSFSIGQGEIVGLVGESGSGKTVVSQSILQLIPRPPGKILSGAMNFEGVDLLQLSEAQMKRVRGNQISMIFQDPMTSLNPTMRIGNQIMEALVYHAQISTAEARARALDALADVGIPDPKLRFNNYPHQFSGGMRQRVMIAMALVCNPKLLIADEPTTALDVTIQAQILELMKKLNQERKTSILLITHDLGVVAGLCDRVIVMYAGKVMEVGGVDELFACPTHPYTQALLKAVPRLSSDQKRPLVPIEGVSPDLRYPDEGCPFLERCPHAMEVCRMQPPAFPLGEERYVNCWLQHPFAENRR